MEDRPNLVNMELNAAEGDTKPRASTPARPAVVAPALRSAAPYTSGGPIASTFVGAAGLGGAAFTYKQNVSLHR